jgi:cytochrome c biogenesis protein CcmG/thiol:disulfide interchange protein DsbE
MKRFLAFLPLGIAAIVGLFALWGLTSDRDPASIPSVLIAKPLPEFDLAPIPGVDSPGVSTADLQNAGEIVVVNVFASWCLPCRAEHPVLIQMAKDHGFKLVGINYKDTPEKAAAWLEELGNPYDAIGSDQDGRAGLFLGITGVPETFIIGADGIVRYKEPGPVLGDGKQRFLAALGEL